MFGGNQGKPVRFPLMRQPVERDDMRRADPVTTGCKQTERELWLLQSWARQLLGHGTSEILPAAFATRPLAHHPLRPGCPAPAFPVVPTADAAFAIVPSAPALAIIPATTAVAVVSATTAFIGVPAATAPAAAGPVRRLLPAAPLRRPATVRAPSTTSLRRPASVHPPVSLPRPPSSA